MKSQIIPLRASPVTFHGMMDVDRELGQDREPDLVVAFLAPDGNAADTLGAMAEVWPSSERLGCEAQLQFAGAEITDRGALHCFWLENSDHRVHVEVLEGSHDAPPDSDAMRSAVRAFEKADSLFLLADGLRFPLTPLLHGLRRRVFRRDATPTVAGISPSCEERHPARGENGFAGDVNASEETPGRVIRGTDIFPSACLLLGFEGVELHPVSTCDFRPASPVYTVNRAAGDVAYEIDGEAAADWYQRFFLVGGRLAPMPRTAYAFPLMIEGPAAERRGLCRAMRAFDDPPGSVTFWGDIREGEQVRLGLGQDLSLIRAAARGIRETPAEAALFGTFTGRQLLLAEKASGELAELHQALGGIALSGATTLREIGPGTSGGLEIHNQSALLALLREKTK